MAPVAGCLIPLPPGYSSPNDLKGKNVNVLIPLPDALHHTAHIQRYMTTLQPRILGIKRDTHAKHKLARARAARARCVLPALSRAAAAQVPFVGVCGG